jgi:hypothetical protein
MKKALATIRILSCLFMARMFGTYRHSVGGHDIAPYAVYRWRGRWWHIPTGSVGE